MTQPNKQKDSFEFPHPQSQSMVLPGTDNPDVENAQQQIEDLRTEMQQLIQNHKHDGGDATRINFNTDIIGLFETVSVAPTAIPKSPFDQVKIYVNGATLRLYWYDATGNTWHYVTATA